MEHGRALRADPGYAAAASGIVHRALVIDFRGGRSVLDLPAVLREGGTAGVRETSMTEGKVGSMLPGET